MTRMTASGPTAVALSNGRERTPSGRSCIPEADIQIAGSGRPPNALGQVDLRTGAWPGVVWTGFLNRIAHSAVRASPDFRNDAAGAATSTSSKLPSDHSAIVVKNAPRCLRLIELVDDRDHPANALRRSDGRVINPVVGPK